jgi:hypothetical protein
MLHLPAVPGSSGGACIRYYLSMTLAVTNGLRQIADVDDNNNNNQSL